MTTTARPLTLAEMAAETSTADLTTWIGKAMDAKIAAGATAATREHCDKVLAAYGAEKTARHAAAQARNAELAERKRQADARSRINRQAHEDRAAAARLASDDYTSTDTSGPATPAQVSYLRSLIAADPASCFVAPELATITKAGASAAITLYKNEV